MTLHKATGFGGRELCHAGLIVFLALHVPVSRAQDLSPRAYLITPVHSNGITLSYSNYSGGLLFDGSVPITDATARVGVSVLTYTHSLHIFGRSANFSARFPYGAGHFRGKVTGAETDAYRSGAFDSFYRLSVNLKGGQAMNVEQFRKWRQRTILGLSVKVAAPTGQYDPTYEPMGHSSQSSVCLGGWGTDWWIAMEPFGFLPQTESF